MTVGLELECQDSEIAAGTRRPRPSHGIRDRDSDRDGTMVPSHLPGLPVPVSELAKFMIGPAAGPGRARVAAVNRDAGGRGPGHAADHRDRQARHWQARAGRLGWQRRYYYVTVTPAV